MSIELPYLETFCQAAELLNFTATADKLDITQAAVSQRIKTLENDLGLELFDRQPGRVYLSEAGRKLYEVALRILALHREARALLGQPQAALSGELRLAASTIPAEHLLPEILQDFRKAHAGVHVVAIVGDSAEVLHGLEEGSTDLALVGKPGPTAWCESRPFARDRVVLVVPPAHPWARKTHLGFDKLAGENLIVRERGSATRECLEQGLHKIGKELTDLPVRMEMGSNEAIKEAVLRGSGLAFLSVFAVHQDVASGRLAAVEVDGLKATRDLFVVWDRRRVLPPAARAFLQVIENRPFTRLPSVRLPPEKSP